VDFVILILEFVLLRLMDVSSQLKHAVQVLDVLIHVGEQEQALEQVQEQVLELEQVRVLEQVEQELDV
jgi:hypothetical protein